MSSDIRLECYRLAIEMHNVESGRFWLRNGVFILLTGALLTGFKPKDLGAFWFVALSALGLALTTLWYSILVRGKDQINRWCKTVEQIEEEHIPDDSEYIKLFKVADTFAHGKKPLFRFLDRSASESMNILIGVLSIFWSVCLVGSLFWSFLHILQVLRGVLAGVDS